MANNYTYNCGCGKPKIECGCNQPELNGCNIKTDLLCTNYTGIKLLPLNIEPGTDGNQVIKIINDYIRDTLDNIDLDPTVITSIGGKVDIYKGLSDAFEHEIKSIQGEKGVIVENLQANPQNCDNQGDYINVKIDTVWLTNFLNEWITTVDLCPLIANCGEQPIQTPTVTNIPINLSNRATKIFTIIDFTNHYTDPQGDALTTVRLTGNVTGYKYDNNPYVVNTEVTIADLTSGKLKYVADDVDTQYVYTTTYQAKDSQGNWSNIADIIATVAAKQFIILNPTSVSLIRGISNSKTATVTYSNGTGQVLSTGQVLHLAGTVGNPGYLKISVQTGITLTGTGSFNIIVDSIPTASQANQGVNYNIDGSTGVVNLTYNSQPQTSDVLVSLPNRGVHDFTTAEFVAAYFDFDGDTLAEIRATSNVTGYEYDSTGTGTYVPYVAGTWIPVNDIAKLKYTALNQNAGYTYSSPWQAKDNQGNIST